MGGTDERSNRRGQIGDAKRISGYPGSVGKTARENLRISNLGSIALYY